MIKIEELENVDNIANIRPERMPFLPRQGDTINLGSKTRKVIDVIFNIPINSDEVEVTILVL